MLITGNFLICYPTSLSISEIIKLSIKDAELNFEYSQHERILDQIGLEDFVSTGVEIQLFDESVDEITTALVLYESGYYDFESKIKPVFKINDRYYIEI